MTALSSPYVLQAKVNDEWVDFIPISSDITKPDLLNAVRLVKTQPAGFRLLFRGEVLEFPD